VAVLVTGASGHLGNNLVRLLLSEGHEVYALVHQNNEALKDLPALRHVHGDLFNPKSLETSFSNIECVFHLAGKISIMGDPDGSVWKTNVEGSFNVAQAARKAGVKKLIHVSSVHAYDAQVTPGSNRQRLDTLDESFPLLQLNSAAAAYDISKAEGERQVRTQIAQGLNVTVVHPTGVIGPFDFAPSRMGQLFLDLKNRSLPSLIAGEFDFVDVRDVARGLILAWQKGNSGENYLLGGRTATIKELAQIATDFTSIPPPSITCPMWLARASAPLAEFWSRISRTEALFTRESLATLQRQRKISSAKALSDWGYAPRPLEESIADLYTDFSRRGL